MKPEFVDFHAHLDLYPDLPNAIAKCDKSQTATLAVTTTPRAFPKNNELASKSNFVRAAIGLHPQLIAERAAEVNLFEELLSQTRYVGEIGLDASPRFYRSFQTQKDVFERILKLCAKQGNKVLSIHSVRSTKPVLEMLESNLVKTDCRVVLHWFTGSAREAQLAVDLGCYFSVNEQMLSSKKANNLIKKIPKFRILTETDGPFVESNGSPVAPGDVRHALTKLSKTLELTEAQTKKLVINNLYQLLS